MEIDTAVGLAAVQVQGHREDRELRGDQQVDQQAGPAELQESAGQEFEESVHRDSGYTNGARGVAPNGILPPAAARARAYGAVP
jgi:hypothetical protein